MHWLLILHLATGETVTQPVSPELCLIMDESLAAGASIKLHDQDGNVVEVLEGHCQAPDPCDCQEDQTS